MFPEELTTPDRIGSRREESGRTTADQPNITVPVLFSTIDPTYSTG